MQEIWFNGTKKEDRERVKQDIALAHNAFKRLSGILRSKLKENLVQDYDKASWPFNQADTLGYNRALTEVLKLMESE